MSDVLAHCVEPGWVDAVLVPNLNGDPFRVLFYADGTARFEHRCDRAHRNAGVIVCAPLLQLEGGHRIVQLDPLTIEPSIACGDCMTHGFIRGGHWVSA